MKISVLGSGRWGSFIAWYLNKIGHDVLLWGKECTEELKNTRNNGMISYPESIFLTNDLNEATQHAQIYVISISSQALRSFLNGFEQKALFAEKPIVLCMKGIE
jgi:glycerol-3-phosphate dehydrogenase (NAD(P)+)